MKRAFSLLLVALLLCGLTACKKKKPALTGATTVATTEADVTTAGITATDTTAAETTTEAEAETTAAQATTTAKKTTTKKSTTATKATVATAKQSTTTVKATTTTTTKTTTTTTKATTTTAKATTTTTKAAPLTFQYGLSDYDWEVVIENAGSVSVVGISFKDSECLLNGYGEAVSVIGSQAEAEAEYQKDPSMFIKYKGKLYVISFGDGCEMSYTEKGNTVTITTEMGTLVCQRIEEKKLEVVSDSGALFSTLKKGDILGVYTGRREYQ